jgi:hypothetical protein
LEVADEIDGWDAWLATMMDEKVLTVEHLIEMGRWSGRMFEKAMDPDDSTTFAAAAEARVSYMVELFGTLLDDSSSP